MCIFSNSDVKNKKISNSGLVCYDLFNHSTNYMEMSRLIAYILQVLDVFGVLYLGNYERTAVPFLGRMVVFGQVACKQRW